MPSPEELARCRQCSWNHRVGHGRAGNSLDLGSSVVAPRPTRSARHPCPSNLTLPATPPERQRVQTTQPTPENHSHFAVCRNVSFPHPRQTSPQPRSSRRRGVSRWGDKNRALWHPRVGGRSTNADPVRGNASLIVGGQRRRPPASSVGYDTADARSRPQTHLPRSPGRATFAGQSPPGKPRLGPAVGHREPTLGRAHVGVRRSVRANPLPTPIHRPIPSALRNLALANGGQRRLTVLAVSDPQEPLLSIHHPQHQPLQHKD